MLITIYLITIYQTLQSDQIGSDQSYCKI